MLALLALSETLALWRVENRDVSSTVALAESSGLAASLLALLFVATLDRLLSRSQLHDTLVESAVDAVVRISAEGTFTFLNPAFESLTGWRREDWLGRPVLKLVYPDDRALAQELFAQVLEGAVLPRPELRILTREGDVLVGEFAFTPEIRSGRRTGVLAIGRDITEPKKAEADLRRLEKRYRYVFRDAPAMYVLALVKDEALIIDDCNNTFLDKLGYQREEVLGREIASFYPPASHSALLDNDDFADTAGGRSVAHERQLETKSGEVLETLLRARPERDGDGAVIGTLAMFVDVTASKRAALERDEALAKFESIAHHVPHCFWSTMLESDGSRRVDYVSPGWGRIWGYEPEDLYQNADLWLDCVLPEDRDLAKSTVESAIGSKTTQTVTYRIRSKSGDLRWIEDEMSPVVDADGDVSGLEGMAQDITARKDAEDALKRSEEKYRELFEDSLDAIFISSPQGKLLTINRSGLELFGYDSADEIEDVVQLYQDRTDREYLLDLVVQRGQLRDYDLRLKKKDGSSLRVRESLRAIRDPAGRVVALQGILRDVTGERELERQLARSQRMDAVGRLAGGIAHDFNNILTVIFGYLSLVRDKVDTGESIGGDLDGIESSGDRAAALVRQLLVFSRQQKLEPTILDLNEIVGGMRRLLERSIGEDIEMEVHLDEAKSLVKADASQMEQVLMNLVVNAREAMPDGGTLIISTAAQTVADAEGPGSRGVAPGSYVLLTVTDTGVGMDAATQQHIFEPFYTTKSAPDRSGLGLSTTYAIVEQSGGFIGVESEEGRGTTFRIYVPTATASRTPTVDGAFDEGSLLGDETVLVVEDEERLLDILEHALVGKGYSVLRANDADIGLEFLEDATLTIDLMVTDVVLPGSSGLDLIEKAATLRPSTKILAMSGYAGHPSALGELAFPFLAKPFTPEALTRKVREVLDLV